MDSIHYNIFNNLKKGTQKYILAEIFNENEGKWITKREIEKQLVLRWSLLNISNIRNVLSITDLINNADYVPGDIQRDLRLFFENFKKYGLEKREKNKEYKSQICYKWNPIKVSEMDDLIHPIARKLFKQKKQLHHFYEKKNHQCEICGCTKKNSNTKRFAVDHWRAYSVYHINDIRIAVLLCEKCNNIHHNYDASKIALKYKDNICIVKNWIKKETDIRKLGFMPNHADIVFQKQVISEIIQHHCSYNPLPPSFFEGLI